MNFFKDDVSQNDPRKFIAQQGFATKAINRTTWRRENWFRKIQVIKDVSIVGKQFSTATHHNCLTVNPNQPVSFSLQPKNGTIADNAKFDMYVFYGDWYYRKQIAMKVVLKPKNLSTFLSINYNNDSLISHSNIIGLSEFFHVEQGWGDGINDILLKSHNGRYLFAWHQHAAVHSVVPVVHEQLKVLIP